MKLKPVTDNGATIGYSFYCPGCDHGHVFWTSGAMTWSFNGDVASPTFSPSLLNTCPNHPDPKQRVCHLFLHSGRLQFRSDCTHDLAGQTVDLIDRWPDPPVSA